jgi:hypothetical protein
MRRPPSFIKLVHKRVASVAVAASTVRGMGPKGTAAQARSFLARVNLKRFVVASEKEFARVLELTTQSFCRALPKAVGHWGLARKLLNIFLRDAAHNRVLNRKFGLAKIERWMEVPLDSHVGKQLRAVPEGRHLPAWKTVVGLQPEVSEKFQIAASRLAKAKGLARVDLDICLWRKPLRLRRPSTGRGKRRGTG